MNLTKGGISKVVDRWIELRVIPDVVEFGPEFRAQPFGDLGVLDERDVPVLLTGTHDRPNSRVPEAGACPGESVPGIGKRESEGIRKSTAGISGAATWVWNAPDAGRRGERGWIDPSIKGAVACAPGSGQSDSLADAEAVAFPSVGRV